MLMNWFDVFMQNNSLFAKYRTWWANKATVRFFAPYAAQMTGRNVLEIGCGSGCGTAAIVRHFPEVSITATDLDPRLLNTAKRKLQGTSVQFELANACSLPYTNGHFDAIFDFGVLHHIAEWRVCLSELRRVLGPNGKLFIIDSPIEAFRRPLGRIVRTYTLHPYDEMFTEAELVEELASNGFCLLDRDQYAPFIYYTVLVAERLDDVAPPCGRERSRGHKVTDNWRLSTGPNVNGGTE